MLTRNINHVLDQLADQYNSWLRVISHELKLMYRRLATWKDRLCYLNKYMSAGYGILGTPIVQLVRCRRNWPDLKLWYDFGSDMYLQAVSVHVEQKLELVAELDGWRPRTKCKARRTARYKRANSALKALNDERKKARCGSGEPASEGNPASPVKVDNPAARVVSSKAMRAKRTGKGKG
jgi:hypothetical protein